MGSGAPPRAAEGSIDDLDGDGVEAEEAASAPMKKAKAKPAREQEPEPGVALREWDPDTPYLRELQATKGEERYRRYLALRAEWGGSPAYFLDCSDLFRRGGQAELALRVLSTLAELELEEPALLRVLAHRLAQLDELDAAIAAFEEVLALRPEEPQSTRDLALVLERRARAAAARRNPEAARRDYRRALELLARTVMGTWDRFDGIEVIALVELNHALHAARALGVEDLPVDKRLVKHLDMDVRIVMTWDADLTDMDLHLIEPSGEEAYYSHNRTTIGGMVSRDFTRGYGPEVYSLRRAMRGTYEVQTKFFGSSAAKLIGAVTLQVDVYTNYGRHNERRRSMTLRLAESKDTFTVGEIEF